MSRAEKFLLIAVLTITQFALSQTGSAPRSRQPGGSGPEAGTPKSAPQSTLIQILTPVAGQRLTDNFTTVAFELINPSAYDGTPNYLVQMDGSDPITTSERQHAFAGLAPGAHTVTIQLVDANRTPVPGGRAALQFLVATPSTQPSSHSSPGAVSNDSAQDRESKSADPGSRPPASSEQPDDPNLPPASSPLPLISIIGFGILVGGIVSAMKTRS